ncbi:MAG: DUF1549 domain-containing protein [Planctomycetales bacterium]|nr:DUF1549 domain-containing protein [Planctomycetales bacterium]
MQFGARLRRLANLAAGVFVAMLAGLAHAQETGLDPAMLPGLVQDDAKAAVSGPWSKSVHTRPFLGEGYLYAAGGEKQTVTFSLEVKEAGVYQVLLSYTPGSNRTEKAAVLVHAADGVKTLVVNQMKKPEGPYCFQPLGEFKFEAGKAVVVVSAEANMKGVVIADGVQLLTSEQFKIAQDDAPKKPPKLLPALAKNTPKTPNPTPAKPKDPAKKEEPPQQQPEKFVRKAPGKPLAKLTPAQLDELMEQHVGGIKNSQPISDEAFLRRVTLDLLGRQPKLPEMDSFLVDERAGKRSEVVEKLLASPEFGVNWANYWSDVISYRTPQPELTFLNYTSFKRWLAERFNQNAGWDETTYAMLTAVGKVGENPAATFVGFHQGDKSRLAAETTRVFLSTQIACAECHDHKFVEMPQETFHHIAAFFVRVNTKLPWNDSDAIIVSSKAEGEHKMPGGKSEMQPIAFSERKVDLGKSDVDRRTELADWIVAPENPWFAKAMTNRIWGRMMGRGFSEPVDEIGELGDRVLPEVHAAVAEHFVAAGYDMKDVFRLVANSKAYQRTLRDPDKTNKEETKPFAIIAAGRLRGDEVFDSLAIGIGLPNLTPPPTPATDAIRFPPPPKSTRDLVSDAFGFDPSSDAGNVSRTMQQAMLLMNNEQIQKQIDASPGSGTMLAKLVAAEADDAKAVTRLYENVLARKPNAEEIDLAKKHVVKVGERTAAYEDLLWSLVNGAEFLSRR